MGTFFNAAVNAPLTQGYSNSYTSGGSQNTGQSVNSSWNNSVSESSQASGTDAAAAREWSAQAAEEAWQRDMFAMGLQMQYNTMEAQKQRDWQEKMANTIYTRSVKNMKKAGINPILAANMGLSGASVGSGATASLSGVPSAPLAQNFMDSWSAGSSASHASGEAFGEGFNQGSSWNEGWSNSEQGIVTALTGMATMAEDALNILNSGNAISKTVNALENFEPYNMKYGRKTGENIRNNIVSTVKDFGNTIKNKIISVFTENGGHSF